MKINWSIDNGKYINAYIGKVGKWKCFTYHYDSMRSKEDPFIYKLECYLPGIKSNLGKFETKQECIEKAQKVCDYWFEKLKEDVNNDTK